MSSLIDLAPALAGLAAQAEATSRSPHVLADGLDEIPAHQRAAWRRVLKGCVSGEGLEEWAIGPMIEGLRHVGIASEEVVRFFHSQGEDELRHRDHFAAYLQAHFDEPAEAPQTMAHRVLYEGVFQPIIRESRRHPLRLLMPLLFYERAAGSLYMTRLIGCTGEATPRLRALLMAVRHDEARHVAGVGMTCRALVRLQRPDWGERRLIEGICRLVYADMDRNAWWKPGLADHMRALGLDAAAMARDNALVMKELATILEGHG